MGRCHEVSSGLVFGSLFARFVFDTGRSAMSRRSIFSLLLFLACACFLNLASAQVSTVPPGALSSPVIITMFDQTGDPNDASVFHVYSFAPAGTQFIIPATVDLPSPPLTADQVALIEVSDDGVVWTAIATTPNGTRVSGPIAHFSKCRTRAAIKGPGGGDLNILDLVGRSAIASLIPPAGEAGTCNPVGNGFCFKMKNPDT